MPRILVVRLGAMGDILHTLPAAATLRRSFPAAHITWLIEHCLTRGTTILPGVCTPTEIEAAWPGYLDAGRRPPGWEPD